MAEEETTQYRPITGNDGDCEIAAHREVPLRHSRTRHIAPVARIACDVVRANDPLAYSDSPCVGAKVVDATPTQGMDKTTGQSRKGKDVQTVEMNTTFDRAFQPVTGRTPEEMDVMRRRIKLSGQEHAACASLDGKLPGLESNAAVASGSTKARADVELYKARKRFFDLKC